MNEMRGANAALQVITPARRAPVRGSYQLSTFACADYASSARLCSAQEDVTFEQFYEWCVAACGHVSPSTGVLAPLGTHNRFVSGG